LWILRTNSSHKCENIPQVLNGHWKWGVRSFTLSTCDVFVWYSHMPCENFVRIFHTCDVSVCVKFTVEQGIMYEQLKDKMRIPLYYHSSKHGAKLNKKFVRPFWLCYCLIWYIDWLVNLFVSYRESEIRKSSRTTICPNQTFKELFNAFDRTMRSKNKKQTWFISDIIRNYIPNYTMLWFYVIHNQHKHTTYILLYM
jgi:hypothetical protein